MIKVALLSRWHVHADDYARDIKEINDLSIELVWDEEVERGEGWAKELNVPFLGEIPLVQSVREGGDTGIPVALAEDSLVYKAFDESADQVVRQVAIRNADTAPTSRYAAAAY